MNIQISLDLALELLRDSDAIMSPAGKKLRAITLLQQVNNMRSCKNCLGHGLVERRLAANAVERITCPECKGVQS